MAIRDLVSKIIVEDQFTGAFEAYEKRLERAEGKTQKMEASLRGLVGVAGVVGGSLTAAGVAIKELTDAAVANDKAMANLAISAQAANNEFGQGVGSVESWKQTIADLGQELRIYGDQDMANATARLIDMTKRLGLSEAQMEETLRRTADLSAGKVELSGGVERVTAALRGEAESAEYLGLSLNETQVRAYAEAQGLVWQQLSDNEKVQVRYALFLEQTNAQQGRAAAYAETAAGAEEALNAQWERQAALLGQQLLPLRQGAVELMSALSSSTQGGAGIITKAFAAIVAQYVTFGVVAKAVLEEQIARLGSFWAGVEALVQGRNPFEAFKEAMVESQDESQRLMAVLGDIGGIWQEAYNQTIDGWDQANNALEKFNQTTQEGSQYQLGLGSAGRAAAEEMAEAYEKAAEAQVRAQERFAERRAQLEFDHQQRMERIQEDIARTTAEAAAEAAQAREASAQKLANSLAQIEADLAQRRREIGLEFGRQLGSLAREREAAEREYLENIENLERDTAERRAEIQAEIGRRLADLAQETADKRADLQLKLDRDLADLEQDSADRRTDILYEAEQDRLRIEQDYQEQLVRLQQDFADRRRAIDDEYEQEYAEADPFRRQMLEYNRREALKQLDEQERAETDALENSRDQSISTLEDRVAREMEILERESRQKRDRLERDLADRLAILEREAEQEQAALEARRDRELADLEEQATRRRQALEEDIQDRREHLAQRERELRESLAREMQAAAEAAAQAKAAQQEQHRQELQRIQEQEQRKIQQAQEALAREERNYQDRLASLQFSYQQELAATRSQFQTIQEEEREYYRERLQEAQRFASAMRGILGGSGGFISQGDSLAGIPGFAEGGTVPGPEGRPTLAMVHGGEQITPAGEQDRAGVVVENMQIVVQSDQAGAMGTGARIGRSVRDVLEGF